MVAIDAWRIFILQIDVAFDPGAEVMGVTWDIVFPLARLDAAQAADAFCGIDAERPTVLGPVIPRNGWHRAAVCCGFPGGCCCLRRESVCRHCCGATSNGASKTTQKVATLSLLLLELFVLFHFELLPAKRRLCRVSLATRVGVVGRRVFDIRVAQVVRDASHHGILAGSAPVCSQGIDKIILG